MQANPTLVKNGSGFLALWSQQEAALSGGWDIYARAFTATGESMGAPFRVNDFTTGDQFGPKAVVRGESHWIVWTSVGQDGSREGVYARALQAGALSGNEVRLNDTTPSRQFHPAVAISGPGRALAIWAGFAGASGLDLYHFESVLNDEAAAAKE